MPAGDRGGSSAADGGRESSTRRKMTDAALRCIVERGLYRASSNEIARQAGVSWGVIQHHFGTREALMLAAVTDGTERLVEGLRSARIDGDTTAARVRQLVATLEAYYDAPESLAIFEILLNFDRDPKLSEQTADAVKKINRRARAAFGPVMAQVIISDPPDRELESFVFLTIRGFWLGRLTEAVTAVPSGRRRAAASLDRDRERLVLALTAVIDAGPGASGRPG